MKKKIYEYDVLRVVTMLLVIIGHTTYYKIITEYGGIDYLSGMKNSNFSVIYLITSYITKLIYEFHMPLFMFLSGALFYYTFKKTNFYDLIKSKSIRLLVPFILVSIFYSIPLKYISGYFVDSNSLLKDIVIGQILIQGNTYLWFLPTLFSIFIIFYIFGKSNFKLLNNKYVVIFILLLMYEISGKISIVLIKNIAIYCIWFYLGFCFEPLRDKINKLITVKTFLLVVFLFLCLNYFEIVLVDFSKSGVLIKITERIIKTSEVFVGISMTYSASYLISKHNFTKGKVFSLLSKDSFSLYLYSDPWNYVFIAILFSYFGNSIFTVNIITLSVYIFRIIFTFLFAELTILIIQRFNKVFSRI